MLQLIHSHIGFYLLTIHLLIISTNSNELLAQIINAQKVFGSENNYEFYSKVELKNKEVIIFNQKKIFSKNLENETIEEYESFLPKNIFPTFYYIDTISNFSIYCNNNSFIDIYPIEFKPSNFPQINCSLFLSISKIDNNSFLLSKKNDVPNGKYKVLYFKVKETINLNKHDIFFNRLVYTSDKFICLYIFNVYFFSLLLF